jgi:hypothetical protein
MSPEPKPRSMAAVTITVLRFRDSLALVKPNYMRETPRKQPRGTRRVLIARQ